MRLSQLNPMFLRYEVRANDTVYMPEVETIQQSMGVLFWCPRCQRQTGGPHGGHTIICWSRSRGTPDSAKPRPGRWTLEGSGFEDLTLNGDPLSAPRSVMWCECKWHGYVTKGEVIDFETVKS